MTASSQASAAVRRPCAWCEEPNRWPDRCTPDLDETCAEIIETSHLFEDHRRCQPDDCEVANRWHEHVIDAGCAAAEAAGHAYGVVSILGDRLAVVGTNDHLGRAKSLLRSGAAKKAGYSPYDPASKGLVYVVRCADGALL